MIDHIYLGQARIKDWVRIQLLELSNGGIRVSTDTFLLKVKTVIIYFKNVWIYYFIAWASNLILYTFN